jgi:hypothetical protein
MKNRLPENEPSDSKPVEDIKNSSIRLEKMHSCFILYNYYTMYAEKNNNETFISVIRSAGPKGSVTSS